MELEEEKGISLGHLCKVAFRRWNVLLIVMASIFILGFIAIQAFYNRSKVNYTSTFDYDVVGLSNAKYIDGEKFDYRDLIGLDNLNYAKKLDEAKFKSIDTEALVENGDISVKAIKGEENKTVEFDGYFQITVLARYFDNERQAKDFMNTLVQYPLAITKFKLEQIKYADNLDLYETATILETKIDYLVKQLNLLDSKYDEMINDYGDLFFNNVLISKYKSDLDLYFVNNPLESLKIEIEENGYILNNTEYLNSLRASIYNLVKEKEANTTKINQLEEKVNILIEKATAGDSKIESAEISAYNTQIAQLTTRNVDIDTELNIVNRKINNASLEQATPQYEEYQEKLTTFVNKLNSYEESLKKFTNKFIEIQKDVVTQNCIVYYADTAVLKGSGGLSTIVTVVLCLIAGLVVGCAVNLILDRKLLNEDNYKKFIEEKEKNKSSNTL